MIHGSAISVGREGYLFTAKGGTGKSSHARLWRELLGDRAVMMNDGKPFIRVSDVDFRDVYPILVQQTYYPSDREMFNRTFELLDRLKGFVRFYRLNCNKELESAEISYNTMKV